MTTQRRNISQPADWWEAFEQEADNASISLSEWMGMCCKACLPAKTAKPLTRRPPAHRPKQRTPNDHKKDVCRKSC